MAVATRDHTAEQTVPTRLFWTLGLGAFGLAFSITTTAAYLPPLLHRFTGSGTLIGLVLGAEGVFALALSPDRALERHLSYPARAPPPLHARRARPAGLLSAADAVHAEPLDDDADRARVLLRVLRVRAAVPRPVSRPAAAVDIRACAGDPARAARDRARLGARRRRVPPEGLARRPVRACRVRDDRGVRRGHPLGLRRRRPRARVRGRRRVFQAQLAHPAGRSGGASLPARQRRLGRDLRGGA